MIRIRVLGAKGDETKELTVEEAEDMVEAELGTYYVVNAETKKIMREIKLEDGMSLMLLPAVRGG